MSRGSAARVRSVTCSGQSTAYVNCFDYRKTAPFPPPTETSRDWQAHGEILKAQKRARWCPPESLTAVDTNAGVATWWRRSRARYFRRSVSLRSYSSRSTSPRAYRRFRIASGESSIRDAGGVEPRTIVHTRSTSSTTPPSHQNDIHAICPPYSGHMSLLQRPSRVGIVRQHGCLGPGCLSWYPDSNRHSGNRNSGDRRFVISERRRQVDHGAQRLANRRRTRTSHHGSAASDAERCVACPAKNFPPAKEIHRVRRTLD